MASHRIVAEIYKFRMHVGDYSVQRSESRDSNNDNVSVMMHRTRTLFTKRLRSIIEQVTQDDLKSDALELNDTDGVQLQAHVNLSVYESSSGAAKYPVRDLKLSDGCDVQLLMDAERATAEEDDFVTTLSNEGYFELRVRRL